MAAASSPRSWGHGAEVQRSADWLASLQGRDGSLGVSEALPTPGWATPYGILLWAALDASTARRVRDEGKVFFGTAPAFLPDWYAEGFAESFGGQGTFTWDGKTLQTGGLLAKHRLAALQQAPLPLRELLAGSSGRLARVAAHALASIGPAAKDLAPVVIASTR